VLNLTGNVLPPRDTRAQTRIPHGAGRTHCMAPAALLPDAQVPAGASAADTGGGATGHV